MTADDGQAGSARTAGLPDDDAATTPLQGGDTLAAPRDPGGELTDDEVEDIAAGGYLSPPKHTSGSGVDEFLRIEPE